MAKKTFILCENEIDGIVCGAYRKIIAVGLCSTNRANPLIHGTGTYTFGK